MQPECNGVAPDITLDCKDAYLPEKYPVSPRLIRGKAHFINEEYIEGRHFINKEYNKEGIVNMTERNRTKHLVLCSFFAALTGICSIVSIPLPFSPVPVNLALLSVYMAGGLLGARSGAASQLVYLLLGAAGVPVFHNLTGGLAILTGPTGGFIAGYVAAAFLVGAFYQRSLAIKKGDVTASYSQNTALIIGLLTGLTACYTLGTLWFMYTSGAGLASALLLCVVPFLPGDALKILAAFFLIRKLHPLVNKIQS